jgi:hypothetical protein
VTFAFGESVVFTTPGAPTGVDDAQGNPVLGSPTIVTLTTVGVAPLASDEAAETFGVRAITGYLLMLPYGTTVASNATALVRGENFAVQAGSSDTDWSSPLTGWQPGTTLTVRRES